MGRHRILTDEERRTRKNEKVKKWKDANPERTKEHNKKGCAKYRATNLVARRESDRKYALKRRAETPDFCRKVTLKRHGLSMAEYDAMVAAQNGRCAICGSDSPGRKTSKYWHIDHCHETKAIRLLLCNSCNLGLGYFKDSTTTLQRALDYLKKFS